MQPPFVKRLSVGDGIIRESLSGDVDPAGAEKDRLESEIVSALMQFWQGQQERIIGKIRPKVPKDRKAMEDIPSVLDDTFWDGELRSLLSVLMPFIIRGAEAGVALHATMVESMGLAVDWTLLYTEASDWARKHAGSMITKMNQTTRDRVGGVVAEWIESGDSLPALEKTLMNDYGFNRKRAQLVAITETTASYSGGELAAMKVLEDEGYFEYEKQWQTAMDDIVCDICRPLQYDGTNAVSGTMGAWDLPNQSAFGPPAHPGCRCWMNSVPVVPA